MAILLRVYFLFMCGTLSTSTSLPRLYTYDLYNWCNSTLHVDRAVLLDAQRKTDKVPQCVVRVQANTKYQFSISYDKINPDVIVMACQNSLEIFFKSYTANDTDCREFPEPVPLLSLSDTLAISLHNDVSLYDVTDQDAMGTSYHHKIRLLVVPFHTGNCTYEQFRCTNGRCVDDQLRCNPDYFTCASDNCNDSGTTGAIIVSVIAVGSIVIVICIVGCACCCFLMYQKRKKRSRQRRVFAEMRVVANHLPPQANRMPVLTTPPYSPPSDPPPYSVHPDGNDHLSIQMEDCEKEREVTLNANTEREVTTDTDNLNELTSDMQTDKARELTPDTDWEREVTPDAGREMELSPVGIDLSQGQRL